MTEADLPPGPGGGGKSSGFQAVAGRLPMKGRPSGTPVSADVVAARAARLDHFGGGAGPRRPDEVPPGADGAQPAGPESGGGAAAGGARGALGPPGPGAPGAGGDAVPPRDA